VKGNLRRGEKNIGKEKKAKIRDRAKDSIQSYREKRIKSERE